MTESNLPAHDHVITIGNVSGSGSTWEHNHENGLKVRDSETDLALYGTTGYKSYGKVVTRSEGSYNNVTAYTNSSNLQHQHSATCSKTGSDASFSVMNPYLVKYCWERIS